MSRVTQLEVLGSVLSSDGSCMPAVRHRLGKSTSCFWKLSRALCEPALSLTQRMSEFSIRVLAVATYAAGAWTWSRALYDELYRWENSLLRRMAKVKRKQFEDFVKHRARATRVARKVFHSCGQLSIATRYLDTVHRVVASSFVRLCCETSAFHGASQNRDSYSGLVDTISGSAVTVNTLSQCLLPACILWFDQQWWMWRQALGFVLDPSQARGQWRHATPGKCLSWEHVFQKIFGNSWKERAACTKWKQLRGEFREGAYKVFGLRTLEARYSKQRKCGRTPQAELVRERPQRDISGIEPGWACSDSRPRVEIVGDSLLVISWLNGHWKCQYQQYRNRLRIAQNTMERQNQELMPLNGAVTFSES
eukprot:TRINITY_DN22425_c0_g1_i1.p1 TRINITY_DN22425_c0_g1~~TRINITY_DN22425_c0_g1_i1.p1  ORF type:complete len:365 (+),score=19.24 TRINITY_DN22425_c0_g1_i1:329-1423(+)